jgi:hypothetical protein
MSLSECIAGLIAEGRIPASKGAEADEVYSRHFNRLKGSMSMMAAAAEASERALKELETKTRLSKRRVAMQALAQQRILTDASTRYRGDRPGRATPEAMLAHLVRDERAPYGNVEYRWRNIKQSALGSIYDVLAKHRANVLGQVRNQADLDTLIDELHGTRTGDLNAGELADAWRTASEMLRQRFNAAGGAIGKLDDWGLPHSHDSLAIGLVAPDEWIDFVMPKLARDRMVDDSTGQPFGDQDLRAVLADVYETLRTEGWNKRSPGAFGNASTGSRNAEHRFLHFADGPSWRAYQDRFGSADAYSAMLDHIEYMSRDIAMMEILGPNPAATVQWMGNVIEKDVRNSRDGATAGFERMMAKMFGTQRARELRNVGSVRGQLDLVFNEITGANRGHGNRSLQLFGSSLRNWQVSTKLGSAVLSSISDVSTAALTRGYNGIPVLDTALDIVRNLNPLDGSDREFARRAGVIGDEFAMRVGRGGRMHLEDSYGSALQGNGAIPNGLERANELSRRMADTTLRVSGLNAWTNAGREAMGLEFFNAISTFAAKPHADLDPRFVRFLDRYGIADSDWETIRATPRQQWQGADWIMPDAIADQSLRDRLMEGILTEIDFAVPTGGLRQRAVINAFAPGTWLGEIVRTGFQFKMFPLTVISMHGGRVLASGKASTGAKYATGFLAATTLTGIVADALSETSKGRDPRPLADWDTVLRGMQKGGGLGIYGDFLKASQNEYGQGIGSVVLGPSWATADNIASLAKGTEDADTREVRRDYARFMERETPGGSIWFLRAAYERMVIDQVRELGDGVRAEEHYSRVEERVRETGQDFWWRPGSGATGARVPDLGNAFTGAVPEE